jgi:NADPH:quinone reductase-like Zn-dependent oxidoreductase
MELAGVIEAIGKDVRKFKVGDQVFAFSDTAMGCYAEYKCFPENGAITFIPSNFTYLEAAALSFGGTTAMYFLKGGKLQGGERILVNGASGGVGTAVVQLARHFGAEVTGVCSTANLELVRSLGAKHVIDYTQEDFTQNGKTYDVIMDTVGNAPFGRCKSSLTERGRLLLAFAGLSDFLHGSLVSVTSRNRVIAGQAGGDAEDLRYLAELAAEGVFKSVIDRTYPFEEMVEAHHYVDSGHKIGNVVISLKH